MFHYPYSTAMVWLIVAATASTSLAGQSTHEESHAIQPATAHSGAHFGENISAWGNWMVAYADANLDGSMGPRVYLYRRQTLGWNLMETIESSTDSLTGYGLCLIGPKLFVSTATSVLIYNRAGVNNWQLDHAITDDSDDPSSISTIATDGETLVVLHHDSIAIHAFDETNEQWLLEQRIQEVDLAGMTAQTQLAVNGDWMAVGNLDHDSSEWHFVYLFFHTPAGWAHTETIANDSSGFGTSLSMTEDRLAIGGNDPAVSFYHLEDSWSYAGSLSGLTVGAMDLIDDRLLMGSTSLQPGGTNYLGGGTTFHEVSEAWSDETHLVGSDCLDTGDPLDATLLGFSVALAGDWAFVGAPFYGDEEGAVLAYDLDTGPPAQCPADINLDEVVDIEDLLTVINQWGQDCNLLGCTADVDEDNAVGIEDLLEIINNWGYCIV